MNQPSPPLHSRPALPGDVALPPTSPGLTHEPHAPHSLDPQQVMATRELFWQNVIREILTSLSMICALRPTRPVELPEPSSNGEDVDEEEAEPGGEDTAPQESAEVVVPTGGSGRESFDAQLFDGRLAVITRRGDRLPIADVFPLFACGIDTPRERVLSLALECTVFQIRTPAGEVYTLPLHEIATFQALSPELMRRLAAMARRQQERRSGEGVQQPFGFAAFTSISRETPPPMADGAETP